MKTDREKAIRYLQDSQFVDPGEVIKLDFEQAQQAYLAGLSAGRGELPTLEEFTESEKYTRSYTGSYEPLCAYWAYSFIADKFKGSPEKT